jgi:hypothetical protein
MNQQNEILILEELLYVIKKIGYSKTLNLLKKNNKEIVINDPFHLYILDTVCKTFKIEVKDLLENRYVRGDRKYVIGFCVYYLYQDYTLGEICKNVFKNKNKALLAAYKTLISKLNKKDLPYFEIKEELDKKIENYKIKNK